MNAMSTFFLSRFLDQSELFTIGKYISKWQKLYLKDEQKFNSYYSNCLNIIEVI